MDFQPEQNVLEARRNDCQAPRRPLDKAHFKVESSDINQTGRVHETRTTSHKMGRRHQLEHATKFTVTGYCSNVISVFTPANNLHGHEAKARMFMGLSIGVSSQLLRVGWS